MEEVSGPLIHMQLSPQKAKLASKSVSYLMTARLVKTESVSRPANRRL